MKIPAWIAAALLSLALAGCFSADAPLLTDDNTVAPYAKITFRDKTSDMPTTLTRTGNAYLATSADGTLELRFKPTDRSDLYVAQATVEEDGKRTLLFAMIKVDVAKQTAATYKAIAGNEDAGPGLRDCGDGMICIDDLDAYVKHAEAAIDAGAMPDGMYQITVE